MIGRSFGAVHKHRAIAAGLGFAVAAQMTVAFLVTSAPVIAPAIASGRGWNVQLVALWLPLVYTAAFFGSFLVPKLLPRLGGAGLALVSIALGATGLSFMLPQSAALAAVAPLALGLAQGGVTPATSQVVGPYATPRTAGFIMSLRQSAIPAGSMLAGFIMPIFASRWGCRSLFGVSLASAGLVILLLPALQWLNDRHSAPPKPERALEAVTRVLAMPGMRQILFAILTYMMMAASLRSFFTVYLVRDLSFDLATAGLVYGTAQLAGIPGQIGCALVSDRWLSPRVVIAINGALATAAAVLMANCTRNWPLPAIIAVAVVLGFNSLGCIPVMLGEVTRCSPPGKVGALVSGAYLFVTGGIAIGPLLFGAVGTFLGYSGALAAVAMCTFVGAIVAAPLPFAQRKGQTQCEFGRTDRSADA
jgi:predicted MFS family arabinose efflux permease